ncbi:MAG: hypothetical protein B7Y26_01840 [Hydrogenophilales bacterium 16-64-46]|nr:MAG: hypothetical protein B7Z32_01540 [Hydrogenophilales bacterium 12-64-13]OYZ06574.1 MAG: hypothetical protein B7Y26_01840 [Hydrogenophilales bacterium 16-64-46]OZA39282.1 MAG: hypothetical protein B7X87_02945 [Hydrogenophilales bacterium 17-64-34]
MHQRAGITTRQDAIGTLLGLCLWCEGGDDNIDLERLVRETDTVGTQQKIACPGIIGSRKKRARRERECAAHPCNKVATRQMRQTCHGHGATEGLTHVGAFQRTLVLALSANMRANSVVPFSIAARRIRIEAPTMARLLITQDQQSPRAVRLYKPRIKIGRASVCEVQLNFPGVSRRHAVITREGEAFYIEDLDSAQGVRLNGQKIQRALLQHGDHIVIDQSHLEFDAELDVTDAAGVTVVQADTVSKTYALGNQTVQALNGVSVEIARGEFMALAGPSGSGKSTLLNLIGCLDTPSAGRIMIEGQDIAGKTADELADLRLNTLGFVFQTFNLLPVLTALENIEYPLLQKSGVDKTERQKRIAHYLRVVGLERYAHHKPSELSGGQRQRVAIARALATQPRIVLADEPTANLDHKTGEDILRLMKQLNHAEGTTFVFSTHDARVMEMADRVVELSDGRIAE